MDVIPQATPLYATVDGSDSVHLVIGWSCVSDAYTYDSAKEYIPVLAGMGRTFEVAHCSSDADAVSLYTTVEEAQAALLSQ